MDIKILKGSFLTLELTSPITLQVTDEMQEDEIIDKAIQYMLAFQDTLEITNLDIKTERL